MQVNASTRFSGSELARINAELAALLHEDSAPLVTGADRSLTDTLVICGILGGKDVGKSTLINALAGEQVSATHEEVGAGTTRPKAYVHHDSVTKYRARFDVQTDAARSGIAADSLEVAEHDVDTLRNVVLVDMPDFDSELPHHKEIVEAIAPLLDRLIWVVTPRKVADRTWVSLVASVIKDPGNVFCVLNKADELLGDDTYSDGLPASFVQDQYGWFRDIIQRAGCPHQRDHLFVLAAEAPSSEMFVEHVGRRWGDPHWERYGSDRTAVLTIGQELADGIKHLRQCVLSPVRRQDAEIIKQANQRAEVLSNAEAIRRHYSLEDRVHEIERACDESYYQERINEAFGEHFCDVVAKRLRRGLRSETELADDLLAERVEHWPILPIVFWPMRWFVRRLGARFAGTRWSPTDVAEEIFLVRGQRLVDRLDAFCSRVRGDHAHILDRYVLAGSLPETETMARRLSQRAAAAVSELDDELVETLHRTYRPPGILARFAIWFMLIWFPFGQPLAEGFLGVLGAGAEVNRLTGLLEIVRAFGAVHLLTGVVFVGVVYAIMLASMFARCVGQVRRERRGSRGLGTTQEDTLIAERLDDLIVAEVVGPVSAPFVEIRDRVDGLRQRLVQVS